MLYKTGSEQIVLDNQMLLYNIQLVETGYQLALNVLFLKTQLLKAVKAMLTECWVNVRYIKKIVIFKGV